MGYCQEGSMRGNVGTADTDRLAELEGFEIGRCERLDDPSRFQFVKQEE